MRLKPPQHYSSISLVPSVYAKASALFLTLFIVLLQGCASLGGGGSGKSSSGPVTLPFLRLEAGECYYVDDFLPTPDSLVTGKNAGLFLRYYTYKSANYKSWSEKQLMLSFYSRDNRCWSLFDEYSDSNLF